MQTLPGDNGAALGLGCVPDASGVIADPGPLSEAGLISPLPGHASGSGFGMRVHPVTGKRRMHTGLDFGAPTGTAIVAVLAGEVVHAGPRGGYGNLVIVDHGGGVTTYYAHQSAIAVAEGQHVLQGQLLGAVGSTGMTTGPHLHFEIRTDGRPIDPAPYLP